MDNYGCMNRLTTLSEVLNSYNGFENTLAITQRIYPNRITELQSKVTQPSWLGTSQSG